MRQYVERDVRGVKRLWLGRTFVVLLQVLIAPADFHTCFLENCVRDLFRLSQRLGAVASRRRCDRGGPGGLLVCSGDVRRVGIPHWLERRETSRRTSLVIDPPDGRIPPMTAEGRQRLGER